MTVTYPVRPANQATWVAVVTIAGRVMTVAGASWADLDAQLAALRRSRRGA